MPWCTGHPIGATPARATAEAARNQRALSLAQEFIASGDASQACSVIALHADYQGPLGAAWLAADVEAATQAPHPARLQWLAARHPQAIARHETACQVLAAAEWAAGDAASAAGIAAPWIENDTMSRGWLPLAMRLALRLGRRCRRGQTTGRSHRCRLYQAQRPHRCRLGLYPFGTDGGGKYSPSRFSP